VSKGERLTRLSRAALRMEVHSLGIYATSAHVRETRISGRQDWRGQQAQAWTSEVTWQGAQPRLTALTAHSPHTMSGPSPPNITLPSVSLHPHRRGRSNSFLKVEHVDNSNEVALDQAAYANINAEWVNRKGACAFLGDGILTA
jgi:hypothetical protein